MSPGQPSFGDSTSLACTEPLGRLLEEKEKEEEKRGQGGSFKFNGPRQARRAGGRRREGAAGPGAPGSGRPARLCTAAPPPPSESAEEGLLSMSRLWADCTPVTSGGGARRPDSARH